MNGTTGLNGSHKDLQKMKENIYGLAHPKKHIVAVEVSQLVTLPLVEVVVIVKQIQAAETKSPAHMEVLIVLQSNVNKYLDI